ncbi:hypothetical protein HZH68_016357 [Vespula germanica]|uniref:Uncharacterized protein n=1 Tax=Vespula germanica TaxID=30212 RepID=A0A834MPH4_VESGE|nr:hypothetical protein HZH68_016357 [Vespula germanica]
MSRTGSGSWITRALEAFQTELRSTYSFSTREKYQPNKNRIRNRERERDRERERERERERQRERERERERQTERQKGNTDTHLALSEKTFSQRN